MRAPPRTTPTSSAPREQIQEESRRALEIIREVLDTYGFTDYRVRPSLRDPDDPKFLAGDERWSRAEDALRTALDASGIDYYTGIEANFYGPKADFIAKDVLGRECALSTPARWTSSSRAGSGASTWRGRRRTRRSCCTAPLQGRQSVSWRSS